MGKLKKKEENKETLQTPSNFFSVNPSMLNRCEQQLAPFLNNHSISRVKGGIPSPPPPFLQKDTCYTQGYTLRGGIKPSGIIGVHTLDTTANSVIHIHTHLSRRKNRTRSRRYAVSCNIFSLDECAFNQVLF